MPLDRSIAHAMAQLSDPIVMVGPEMKLVYANLAARKLTDDQPTRLIQTEAMREAQKRMREGAPLPMRLSIAFDAQPALPATLFDWRVAGGLILVVRSDAGPAPAPVEMLPPGSSLKRLLEGGLASDLDNYLLHLEQTYSSSREAHEGELIGVHARAFRRCVAALLELGAEPRPPAPMASFTARRLIEDAWGHVASLARERGVEGSLHGHEATAIVFPDSIELGWAFTEALAFMIRRIPPSSQAVPWRIEFRAFRAGTEAVIAVDSIGRVQPQDAGTPLRVDRAAGLASRLPAGAGDGLPLVRSILTAAGGRFELLAGDELVGKMLFRFPQQGS